MRERQPEIGGLGRREKVCTGSQPERTDWRTDNAGGGGVGTGALFRA